MAMADDATAISSPPPAAALPIRIRARAKDGMTEVMVLMPHPMETGLRRGSDSKLVPSHFITDVSVSVAGRVVLEAKMSQAVSADPLLSFRFRGGQPGQLISVSWADNKGRQRTDTVTIV
jgi:sulfur-oxidizing protein SoxZ